MDTGKIVKVAGPLNTAEGLAHANMFDVVRVGREHLIGEIIEMRGDRASIQVYEETAGIGPAILLRRRAPPFPSSSAPV